MITHKQLTLAEIIPKYANRINKQLKAFKKANGLDDSYDPYKATYGSMPSQAAANPAIQRMYINGYFCYAFKFGVITNGRGIIRDILLSIPKHFWEMLLLIPLKSIKACSMTCTLKELLSLCATNFL